MTHSPEYARISHSFISYIIVIIILEKCIHKKSIYAIIVYDWHTLGHCKEKNTSYNIIYVF